MSETVKIEYVNNKELLQAIKDWKAKCAIAGEIVPQNNQIGKAILLIAHGLAKRYNFSAYTASWKEEMIGDGIEAAIRGLFNFDETKYDNPHAYITMACFNAFVQRIKKEKKQTAVKYSFFVNNVFDSRDPEMASIADEGFIQDIYDKMTKYEQSNKPEKVGQTEQQMSSSLSFLLD